MAEDYAREVGKHSEITYSTEKAMQSAMSSLFSPSLTLKVCVLEGKMVGFIWACVGPLFIWSEDIVAMDQILYVKPEYRGTRAGVSLIKAYLSWAKDMGAKEARISCGSGIHEERTNALYEKLGFLRVGAYHRRPL